MAKGRRYGAERLLAAPSNFVGGGHAGPDLSEDEVWPAYHAAPSDGSAFASAAAVDDDRWARAGRSAAGIGRWVDRPVGGLSLAVEDGHHGGTVHPRLDRRPAEASASAPVDVPSWPRLLQTGSGGPLSEREEEDDGEAGADGEWLPPHEYLARAHGRSVATSVLEGVGRTLKGRDVSRVRDAVWNQTGFFG